MRPNERDRVPVAGTTESLKENGDSDAARNSGGFDAWEYPEDVPSSAMRQHQKPRRGWALRGLLALAIVAVITLWAGTALAQTHDAQGRMILHGDPQARPAPHHSGGGPTGAAARYFLSIADEGPFRVSGEWFSSGALVLALVAGPDAMEGSCLDHGVRVSFHRPTLTNPGATYQSVYTGAFLPAFGAEILALIHSGAITHWRQRHYTAAELAAFGYPVCED